MDRSVFSVRLAKILEERKLRQTDLCRLTGINKATISQYMSGKYTAKHDRAVVLARALKCNPLWLEGYDVEMEAGVGDDSEDVLEVGSLLPVLELAVDGSGRLARDNIGSREYAGRDWRDQDHFYIKMPDESMIPLIHMGDLLLCESCGSLENDDIGLFIINGSDICVKRYFRKRNGTALVSADPRWSEYFFPDSGAEAFRIEARVIQCTHRF